MKKFLMIAALGALAIGTSACDVKQTKQGDMPDVEVKGGSLPKYDVDAPDVNIKTEKRTVEVPVIDVKEADAGKKD